MLTYHAGMIEKLKARSPIAKGSTPDLKKSQSTTEDSKCSPVQFAMMAGRIINKQSPSPQRYNKGGFVYPMSSARERSEANKRKELPSPQALVHFRRLQFRPAKQCNTLFGKRGLQCQRTRYKRCSGSIIPIRTCGRCYNSTSARSVNVCVHRNIMATGSGERR